MQHLSQRGELRRYEFVVAVQGDMFNTERFAEIIFGKTKLNKEPLPENKGKSVFVWAGERWSGKEAAPPLEKKELNKVSMSTPRGGRAVAHFRVSDVLG